MANGGAIDFGAMHDELITVFLVVPVSQLTKTAKYLRMFLKIANRIFFRQLAPRHAAARDDADRRSRKFREVARRASRPNRYSLLSRANVYVLSGIGQIKTAYPKEFTQFFTGSGVVCNLRIGAGDTTTAEHLSKTCGQREVSMTSNTMNAGAGKDMRAGASAQTATQFMRLCRKKNFSGCGAVKPSHH